ncbi:MAG: hypothetical protein ABW049_02755 [Spongiibacteraceae bacterium]
MSWLQLAGIIPAIIFPAASLSQLLTIARRKSADGVSVTTWVMVAIANISLFIYSGNYADPLNIIALLGAAALNVCVAGLAIYFQHIGRLSVRRPKH